MARMPKAPGLFSTTNCWPRLWRICSPNSREVMSVAPPGAYGTTIFTGFAGYLSCAEAVTVPATRPSNARTQPIRLIASSWNLVGAAPMLVGGLPTTVDQAGGPQQAMGPRDLAATLG